MQCILSEPLQFKQIVGGRVHLVRCYRFAVFSSDSPPGAGRLLWLLAFSALAAVPARAADAGALARVSITRTNLNAAAGDSAGIEVEVRNAGTLRVTIVDRDGVPVRNLASNIPVVPGVSSFRWDGRDDRGEVVPDEAYSPYIALNHGGRTETYFPAATPTAVTSLDAEYYAERSGTLAYTLAVPSRVHLQAGIASRNGRTGEMEGPVMKTIVNREPRAAGRIAETWNGFDESGTIRISEMRDFVIAIAVVPLPENSIITYGNRNRQFAQSALSRSGASLFPPANHAHEHHRSLSVLDDVSPALEIQPLGAVWSAEDRAWRVRGQRMKLRITVKGPSAAAFVRHPGQIYRFVDGRVTGKSRRPASTTTEIEVPLARSAGVQNVSINWRSDFGPLAANSVRVITSTAMALPVARGTGTSK
jgi:hypothetical protein